MKRHVLLILVIALMVPALVLAADSPDYLADAPNLKKASRDEVADFLKERCHRLYFELMTFKSDPGFAFQGFREGSPYAPWRDETEAVRDYSKEAIDKFDVKVLQPGGGIFIVAGQLWHLGSDYQGAFGVENEGSLRMREMIEESIGCAKYPHVLKFD